MAPWFSYFMAAAVAGTVTVLGYKNNGRYGIFAYILWFLVLFLTLSSWRIWIAI